MPSLAPSPPPSWTSVTWRQTDAAPFGGSGNQYIFGGTRWSGGYVLVGEDAPLSEAAVAGVVWESADGTTWFRVPNTDGTFDAAEIEAVAAQGSTLIAVGVSRRQDQAQALTLPIGLAWISHDGVHWARIVGVDGTIGQALRLGVVAGPGGFVAYGNDPSATPAIFFSADGLHWQREAQGDPAFKDTSLASMTATATSFVAVGSHDAPAFVNGGVNRMPGPAAAWWSTGGRIWHASDVGSGGYALGTVQPWAAGSLRAIGSPPCGGCIAQPIEWRSSDDGRTWSQLPEAPGPQQYETSALAVDGRAVELTDGPTRVAQWSSDGQSWHPLSMSGAVLPDRSLLQIAGDGILIAFAPAYPSPPAGLPGNQVDMLVFLGTLR